MTDTLDAQSAFSGTREVDERYRLDEGALDAWLTGEITSAPDYDPETPVALPPAIRAVVLHLDEAVSRTATLAAEMQRELRLRFGADIDDARQHVLTAEV